MLNSTHFERDVIGVLSLMCPRCLELEPAEHCSQHPEDSCKWQPAAGDRCCRADAQAWQLCQPCTPLPLAGMLLTPCHSSSATGPCRCVLSATQPHHCMTHCSSLREEPPAAKFVMTPNPHSLDIVRRFMPYQSQFCSSNCIRMTP